MTSEPKAVVRLVMNCGCKFAAKSMQEAQAHVVKTGHMMSLHGTLATAQRHVEGKVARGPRGLAGVTRQEVRNGKV